jgi:hypothetical protein
MNITALIQQAQQDDELMQSMSQALSNGFSHQVPLVNTETATDSDGLFEQRVQHQVMQASSILTGLNQVQAHISQQRQAAAQSSQAQNGADDIIDGEFVVDSGK